MPIEIIGRIGSIIETLTGSLDLHVFADAGGRASNQRIWGGLACVGSRELTWLDQKLDELKLELSNKVEETGELKGKHVPQLRAQELGRSLRKEDRRSVFWATWCCEMNNPDLIDLRDLFSKFLSCQKADSLQFENWFRRIDSNFKRLKDANKHKLLSILQLMEWLGEEVRRTKLGHQLNSVRLIVDREDFPNVEACAILIKEALSAILQAAGISYSLTGRAYKEKATEGAITVDLNGDSCKCQGLQCVDILLQVVQRQLPGFSAAGG